MLETVRELKALGVDVYFEEQNIHSMSGDGELMLTILASFAQEESKSVSDNCKWRIRKDFSEGKPMNLPLLYGYRSDGRTDRDRRGAKPPWCADVFKAYLDGARQQPYRGKSFARRQFTAALRRQRGRATVWSKC